ncbi:MULTISPECIES: hypothetical protein [unclassified Mesorhizobium]|uniref:hypothetical protein n=1 Tax=unclassified Mesorhizobium TaxID=325217 RepID=UPI00142F0C52|nr:MULTISPECIES: hypothetical protein [unclassified Mesorhizobium]
MNAQTPTQKQKVVIYLPALAACLPFVSTDATRAYLQAIFIHVKDEATAYVATDGHRLCLAQPNKWRVLGVEEIFAPIAKEHDGIILSAEDAKELVRWDAKKADVEAQHYATMEIPGKSTVEFKSWDGKLQRICKVMDATYPDYARTIPADDKPLVAAPTGFNAAFLADIQKVAKAGFSHARIHSCVLHLFGPANPAKVTMSNPEGDKATIVMMPMRI